MTIRDLVFVLAAAALGCGGSSSPTGPTPTPGDNAFCSRYPSQTGSPYVLPYSRGQAFLVGQTTGHVGEQQFAIDFLMPIGTPALAMRGGRVVRVESSFADSDHQPGHENLVWLVHDDGTIGRYFHLTQGGVRVDVGEDVTQGQVVGLSGNSGNSGNSTAPHLHVDVARCDLASNRCSETLPLSFANTRAHGCGLQMGEVYRAE